MSSLEYYCRQNLCNDDNLYHKLRKEGKYYIYIYNIL